MSRCVIRGSEDVQTEIYLHVISVWSDVGMVRKSSDTVLRVPRTCGSCYTHDVMRGQNSPGSWPMQLS